MSNVVSLTKDPIERRKADFRVLPEDTRDFLMMRFLTMRKALLPMSDNELIDSVALLEVIVETTGQPELRQQASAYAAALRNNMRSNYAT